MKYWWSSIVRDYLSFSKKERAGIVIAIIIGLFAYFVLPRLFRPKQLKANNQALIKELAQLKISVDSSAKKFKSYNSDDENFTDYQPKKNYDNKDLKGELFEFDPNTLNAEGWKRLGVKEKTIQTIEHFLQKGYKFRHPEDIKKIYGLKPGQADRLMEYVRITTANEVKETGEIKPSYSSTFASKKSTTAFIDINRADTTEFTTLPGIGSKLAARIVSFRNKLGGFATVDQIKETYGLPDSTFQKIQPQLQCNQPALQTININIADAAMLKAHPYLSWNIANAIVRYREQHGKFGSVNDLLKIEIISQDVYDKLSPYLVTD